MKRVLSTKILPNNLRQMLLNNEIALTQANFIQTKAVEFELDSINETLLFTSQNAVESVLQNPKIDILKQHKAICVGVKTKALLQQNGFTVLACEDYADNLAHIIESDFKNTSFTFFAGNIRRDTLPNTFKNLRIPFTEIRAYETTLAPQEIKGHFDGILFYSPSGIESYLQHNSINTQVCFCIGTTTANALQAQNNIVLASKPTVENTVVQCINHFKNKLKS